MTSDQQVRHRRQTRVWLALSAVLFLIALLVVPPLISITRYKIRITELVSAALRRPVRLSSVELRILPRPGFVLNDLTVDEDPAYGAEPVLHAATVTTAIRISSLWRGQLQFSRISVDEASLNLVHTPDGRWNIDPLFRTAASLPGAASSSNGRPVPYPYMEATSSRINVKNGAEKLPYSLVGADASLWQDSGVWHVRLKAQPSRTDVALDLADTGVVRVEGTLHPAPELDQMPLHVDLQWNDAQLGQLSRLTLGSDEGWRGDLRGEFHLDGTPAAAQVKSRLRATGVHRAEFAPAAPLDFDANCSFGFRSAGRAIEKLLCESPIGDGRARLTGDVPGDNQPPKLTLELNRVPAQAGLDVLRTLRTNVAPGLQASGSASGKMTYDPSAAVVPLPIQPARRPRGKRAAGPPHPPAGPLAGSFTLEGLRLTGDTLTTPIQVAKIILDPALAIAGHPPALTTTVAIPAGGPTPLSFTARISLHRFQLGVRGAASLPRLRELVHVAGIPQAESLKQLAGDPATLDLAVEGPWLPIISSLPTGPGAPAPLVPAGTPTDEGTMTGAIAFRNAIWKPDYLALPLEVKTATLRFANGALRWDPITFTYGPVQGTATLDLPAACSTPQPCPPHLVLEFDTLDAAAMQSALLGARQSGTLISSLIDRLKPNSTPAWPLVNATLHADRLELGVFTCSSVSAEVHLQSTGAEITSLDAALLGGTFRATGSVTASDKPAYKLSGSFQKLDSTQVLDLMAMKAEGGSIDGSVQLELSGFTEKDLTGSAKGDLHFVWDKGTLASLNDNAVPPTLARFDRVTGDAAIANGGMSIDKAEVRRGSRKSTVSANITFAIPPEVNFPSTAGSLPANR